MDNGRKTVSNFFNSLLSKQAQVAPNTLPDHLREFDDVDKTRDLIYNNVLTSLTNKFPYSDGKHRLELHDVRYSGPQEYTWEEQKKALMNNRSLKTPIKGKWKLFDEETGELLDEKEEVVMDVPYYTQRGTIINNGSEYTVVNQSRLKPGMYTRTKQNGEHEAQFNVKPGTGRGFRLWMEPSTGVFMVNVGQANVPAYPFLKAQGVTDEQMQESWGDEVYQTNVQKSDSQAIGKLYTRFAGNKANNELTEEDKVKYLREAMLKAELDERVVQRTSGLEKTKNVTPELLLRTTNKLLNINRKQEDPDDRDAPEFSNILSVEDFVKERIEKDAGNTARTMLYNIRRDRNLSRVRRGALNSYMSSLLLGSGLAQSIEETNPFQLMDQQNRIIKLGEGGIGSAETITDEARDVNNGQMGFIDPVAGPECFPYDDSVEVLTIGGWKAVTTITTEDKVACLSGNTTVFRNPERVIVNGYTGTMYGFKTPEIEQLVTPTHRNWVKPLGKEHKFRFKEAQATYEQDYVIQGMEKQYRVTKEQHYTIEFRNMPVFCLTVPGGIFMVRTNKCTGFWTGNSDKVGIDVRASFKSFKGNDQQIYAEFLDTKGNKKYLKPEDMTGKVLAFPGQDPTKKPEATAIKDGKMVQVPWNEVDYTVPSQAHMYFGGFNLTPLPTSFQPGRAFYASKYWSQYLPLTKGEVPLVQSKVPGEEQSFAEYYGRKTGAINSKVGGVVTKVTDAGVTVTDEEGKKHLYETVKDFPFNRITAVTYSAKVKPGDVVKPGDMIAHSNFTDKDTGAFNMGVNLKTAVVPYEGFSYEDAYVISESAAKKLETERLMGFDKTTKGENIVNKNKFMSSFAKKFTKEQYDNIDDNGVARPGTIVKYGDPIILAIGPKVLGKEDEKLGKLHKALRSAFKDDSVVWESKFPGVVTDVGVTSSGVKVNVKTTSPAQIGDKLANLAASKGVIGKVVTDSEMPIDQATGEPYEMLLNPMVVLSRVAPNQLAEMQLAKIAKKTGKPYVLPSEPPEEGWAAFAKAELDKNGMTAQNSIYDPLQGREIKNLGEGYMYISAFHHLAEKKLSGRDMVGGYTGNAQPAKGGKTGAKRFSLMDINALLSHGATEVIKDAHLIRGTKNEDYWNTLRAGRPLPEPETPFIYDKFMNTLKAGGINVRKEGDILTIMPMTNADIDKLSAGEIKNSRTVDIKNQDPAPGGLFDMAVTGGAGGKKFGHVTLAEPLPNPVVEEPIRRVLGLTVKQFHDVLTGREQLNGETGGKALRRALGAIDVDKEIAKYNNEIRTTRGARRDNAIKALRYLNAAKQQSISPTDWVIDKVPVIPPAFRPIANVGDMLKAADLNGLYRDVIETNNSIKELRNDIPDSELADEKLSLYKSVTAAFGLGEPITPDGVSKRWKGAIRQVIGTNPKCYDDATEILTENGWVPFPEYVDSRLQVATLNPETSTLEFQNPTGILHEKYTGDMVHTHTRRLDLMVTAGHWHYVELKDDTVKATKWLPPQKVQAMDLANGIATQSRYVIGAANFTGCEFPYVFDGIAVSQDTLAEFAGWYLRRGRVTKDNTVGLARDYNASDVNLMDKAVQTLGLPYKKVKHSVTPTRSILRWEITSPEFGVWVIGNFGVPSRELAIPKDIPFWHKEHQVHLLAAYFGDPARLPSKVVWTTTSKGLVEGIALMCTRIGYVFQSSVIIPEVQWRCTIHKAVKETVSYTSQTTVVSNWQGMVHCVTVPNGLIFVRRNGKVSVSGNTGMFQSNVLSKTVDSVGRGVVVPNPNLDMDTVGIPESKAWTIYRPFIIREMVRRGIPQVKAIELIDNKDKEAKEVMLDVMDKRPVILDRAPTWHKFNLLAFKPVLTDTDTIQVSPLITSGFNMDFDGDTANFHVPVSDKAVQQAWEKMTPSKNLFALNDLKTPQHTPSKEMVMGLYQLTRKPANKKPIVFTSLEEAKKAYKEGLINANDPIEIRGN